jgi:hypothetical protein
MEKPIDENKYPNIVIAYKLYIEEIMNMLEKLHESGVDYIDIGIIKDPEGKEDTLKIGYTLDYLSEEAFREYDSGIILSDDDLDELTD